MRLRLLAPAKVNLSLELLSRRDDGFHELRGVLQTLRLADEVEVAPAPDLALLGPAELGPAEANLALRAARLLAKALRESRGARITLRKSIPVGAGLGGGSSDAGAVLRLLTRLWNACLTPARSAELAGKLGSDVPFFLGPSTALARGRGELLDPLPSLGTLWTVLVCPDWPLLDKTAQVYAAVQPADFTDGRATDDLVVRLRSRLPPRMGDLFNGLEPAARRVFPDLGRLEAELEASGGVRFVLSGAGPSLFHLSATAASARALADRVRHLGLPVWLGPTRSGSSRIRSVEP